ncbi:hypothetical protein U9M48_007481 [Paspalum notatum var. saurae]|uniref:Uncharacterized protein n=1 Tax=Paspalum notatum var. saurae TaxID=547442 RepID=A0AAQ3Q1J7_PASNO
MATCRCVYRPWRDVVDARRLLRPDLRPRKVRGIFMDYVSLRHPEFLSRPSTASSISGDFPGICRIKGHCNGLLLCRGSSYGDEVDYVVNPATRRWARLPPRPADDPTSTMGRQRQIECLAYDPAVAPAHYEAFLIPDDDEPSSKSMRSELPPASYALQVFSSATGRWEERLFVREGLAAARIADMKPLHNCNCCYRMCISNAKYRLVQMPEEIELMNHNGPVYLGISEEGVYCAFSHVFHGFLLTESSSRGDMVREMKHRVDFEPFSRKLLNAREDHGPLQQHNKGPWMLQDINYYNYQDDYCGEYLHGSDEHDKETVQDSGFEWSSDDDNVLNTEDMVEGRYDEYTTFLGFHPYKEIVFLNIYH